MPRTILIATSNAGKLRDFTAAAAAYGITISGLPSFKDLPVAEEDGETFEANARKKAEFYSQYAPGEIVLADDSGLEVAALKGAPGVISARYAAAASASAGNAPDEANNAKLLRELENVSGDKRTARFVAVIAAARDGKTLAEFRGEAAGMILRSPRGTHGFGYDPLFYFPALDKSFAQLDAAEKATVSHRGAAFRQFLAWFAQANGAP